MLRRITRFHDEVLPSTINLEEMIPAVGGSLLIGRNVSSDGSLCVSYNSGPPIVSREHARVTRLDHCFMVEDLQSSNGTFINNQQITAPHALVSGDRLSLGGYDTVNYEDHMHENPHLFIFDEAAEELQPVDPPPRMVNVPILGINLAVPYVAVGAEDVRAAGPPRPFVPKVLPARPASVDEASAAVAAGSCCSVCFEVMVGAHVLKGCGHAFCGACIRRWVATERAAGRVAGCPNCRASPCDPVHCAAWDDMIDLLCVNGMNTEDKQKRELREREWHTMREKDRIAADAKQRGVKRLRDAMAVGLPGFAEAQQAAVTRLPLTAFYSIGHPGVAGTPRTRDNCVACRRAIPFGDVVVRDQTDTYHPRCVPATMIGRRVQTVSGVQALRAPDLVAVRATIPFGNARGFRAVFEEL
jgi:hypothetical protein